MLHRRAEAKDTLRVHYVVVECKISLDDPRRADYLNLNWMLRPIHVPSFVDICPWIALDHSEVHKVPKKDVAVEQGLNVLFWKAPIQAVHRVVVSEN